MKPEPCDSCSETPCDFGDPSEPDGDYRAWGPEP